MNRPHRLACVALAAASAASCATSTAPAAGSPHTDGGSEGAAADALSAAQERDFLLRLAESMTSRQCEDPDALMINLEHLLPSWQGEQRRGREGPIENIIAIKVVTNFPVVLDAFERGTRERRIVAAWALGFSRVPTNDLGIESPHPEAVAALALQLGTRDDALLRNELLALWKLDDDTTPLNPLLEILVHHHDADVRSNAALAVGAVLTPATLGAATDALLVALADNEPKVRLHAAGIARRYPSPAFTERLLLIIRSEETPLVRASMASALGAARARQAAPVLLAMLESARDVEANTAHSALVAIYGVDRGTRAADWADLIQQ